MPTKFIVFLGVSKEGHENQSRYDTSGYDILGHGCHSNRAPMMNAKGAAVNAPHAGFANACDALWRARAWSDQNARQIASAQPGDALESEGAALERPPAGENLFGMTQRPAK